MKKQLATIALIGISLSTIFAQELVKDIYIGTGHSIPEKFVNVGGKLFFSADSQGNGKELWISDGTDAGTNLVKDIQPGVGAGLSSTEIIELNGKAIFAADNGTQGSEIWISDGTSAGTMMITEIHGAPTAGNGSNPAYLTKMGDEIFFNASDKHSGVFNEELWKTDGTAAGTVLVKEINQFTRSRPEYLTEMNGKIYFSADDQSGKALWATDGTEAGTVKIKSNSNSAAFSPKYIVKMGNEIFFNAYDDSNNKELWKSDGTTAGTVLVKDIAPGAAQSSEPTDFIVVGNTLYFEANGEELWKTDGTEVGTSMVSNSFSNIYSKVAFEDALYFVAEETAGREVYKVTLGNAPVLLKDISSGAASGLNFNPYFEVHGSTLFFSAKNSVSNYSLWQTDGTSAGTIIVPNLPTSLTSVSRKFSLGNKLFFNGVESATATELWVFDNLSSSEFTETACPSFDYEGVTHTQTGDYDFIFTNALGYDSTVTLKLTIDCDTASTVGISILQEFEVNAFPNPLGNVLNISSDENLNSISLVNINGAIIKSFDPSLKSFDVSTISKGIYFLELKSGDTKSIVKIIKR